MENYFEFYGIPVSFQPDPKLIRKIYYANSRKYHPDFFTLESAEKQAEVIELSSKNNKAFELFSNPNALLKYVLELQGILKPEQTASVPPMFLMEMMEVNEAIEALEENFSEEKWTSMQSEIATLENQLYGEVSPIIETYSSSTPLADLEKVKNFYLKKQYLLRIKEKLSTFASRK